MRRFSVALAAVAFVVLALGVPLLVLEQPFLTETLSARYSLPETAGLSRPEALALAEQVRAFVVSGEGDLPATVDGRPAFDEAAVSHLSDVAAVISAARVATIAAALAAFVWVAYRVRRGELRDVGAALVSAAAAIGGSVLIALLAAVVDFDAVFSAFHAIFFAEGTWTFPFDSLLIVLFPEPFWSAAGLAWALGTGVLAAAYGVMGWSLMRRAETVRATRKNVSA